MSIKGLLATVTVAALVGFATQSQALPSFQLRIVSGTYDSNAITTPGGGVVSTTVANIDGGGGNKFTSAGLSVQGSYSIVPSLSGPTLYMSLDVPDIRHNSNTAGVIDVYLTLSDLDQPVGSPLFKI
jgi:hypothetical protein